MNRLFTRKRRGRRTVPDCAAEYVLKICGRDFSERRRRAGFNCLPHQGAKEMRSIRRVVHGDRRALPMRHTHAPNVHVRAYLVFEAGAGLNGAMKFRASASQRVCSHACHPIVSILAQAVLGLRLSSKWHVLR